jgi:hypothetical protein
MLAVDFGAGSPIVADATGRQQRGSAVAGLGMGFGGSVWGSGVRYGCGGSEWVRGENVECLQVRLSPLIARTVLGVPKHHFTASGSHGWLILEGEQP